MATSPALYVPPQKRGVFNISNARWKRESLSVEDKNIVRVIQDLLKTLNGASSRPLPIERSPISRQYNSLLKTRNPTNRAVHRIMQMALENYSSQVAPLARVFLAYTPPRFRNSHFYSQLIRSAPGAVAKKAYNEALDKEMANSWVHNAYIDAARRSGDFSEAKKSFQQAQKSGKDDKVTYTSFIVAACQAGEWGLASATFDQAAQHKRINPQLISSYLIRVGNHGNFEEVQKAFETASEFRLTDRPIYSSYLSVARKCQKWKEATAVYEEAVAKNMADFGINCCYIDILMEQGREEEAKHLFRSKVCPRLGQNREAVRKYNLAILSKWSLPWALEHIFEKDGKISLVAGRRCPELFIQIARWLEENKPEAIVKKLPQHGFFIVETTIE